MNAIMSVTASAMFLFSGTAALAGSPYNLAVPAPGLKFKPHVAQPVVKVKPANRHPVLTTQPMIRRSLNKRQRLTVVSFPYTAITQSRARRQGKISAGGANWSCKGNRCTTKAAWVRPTAQACKALAHAVGAIKSFSKRGASLNTMDIRSCNAGIAVAKSKKKIGTAFNPGLATGAPIFTPNQLVRPQAHGSFAPPKGKRHVLSAPSSGGGFAPAAKIPPAIQSPGMAIGNQFNTPVLMQHPVTQGGFAPKQTSRGGFPSFYRATLQHTAKTHGIVLLQSSQERWSCGGTRCDGIYVRQLDVASCRALARTQGSVAAFIFYNGGTGRTQRLSAAQLRQCNGDGQRAPRVVVHVGGSHSSQSRSAPDTVRTGQLVLIGKGASTQPAPDTVRTGELVLIGKGASTQPAPDTVRTGQLVLIGKGTSTQPAPDTVRTGQLVLIGKGSSALPAPDTVRTPTLILIGKGSR